MLIGIIISIILSRILGAEGLGLINLSNKIVAIIMVFLLMGLPQFIVREVAKGRIQKNWQYIGDVMYTSYFLSTMITILISILLIIASPQIAILFFDNDRLIFPLMITLLAMIPQVPSKLFSSGLIGYKKVWQSNFLEQTISVTFVGIVLILLYLYNKVITVNLVAFIYAVSRLIVLALVIAYWNKLFSHRLKYKLISKNIIKDSSPFLLLGASYVISNSIDTIMIGYFIDANQVGLYSVAIKLAFLMSFLHQATVVVLSPKIAELYHSDKKKEMKLMVTRTTRMLSSVALLFLLLFIVFGKFILNIWGVEFIEAYSILIVLCFGQFFMVCSGPAGALLLMTNHEKVLQNITLVALVCNFFLNIILISKFGALGAAISTSINFLFVVILNTIYVYRKLGFIPIG